LRRSVAGITAVLVGLGSLACWAPTGAVEIEDVGRELYLQHCSSCHGSDAKGQGPVASVLDVKPPDLSGISKANGGAFPYAAVFRAIDGRDTPRAHGSIEMPVWGEVFRAEPSAPLRDQVAGAGKMMLITMYLETIQAK